MKRHLFIPGAGSPEERVALAVRVPQQAAAALRGGVHAALRGAGAAGRVAGGAARRRARAAHARALRQRRVRARAAVPRRQVRPPRARRDVT